MASFGGNSTVFGRSVAIRMVPGRSAVQTNTFFGVTGISSLYGGGRGRTFVVSGVLYGLTRSAVDSARATLLSYDDGIARTLVDTGGNSWPQVVFTGQFEPGERYLYGHNGFCLPYQAVFEGRV